MRRNRDRTKEAILNAAEDVFARRGFDATTLEQIGTGSGFSRSTAAYFFGSKSDLYEAVLARVIARAEQAMLAAFAQARPDSRPEDAVATYVSVYLDFLATDHAYLRLIQRESLGDVSRVAQLFGRPVDEAVTALTPAAEKAGVSAQQLLLDLTALCWYPFAHEHTLLPALGLSPRDPAFLAEHKRHVTALVGALGHLRGATRTHADSDGHRTG